MELGKSIDQRAVHPLLMSFSIYLVPAAIAVASVLALFIFPLNYPSSDGVIVPFEVVKDDAVTLDPPQALAALNNQKTVQYYSTLLSEKPHWFLIPAKNATDSSRDTLIELPSRHAVRLACWNARSMSPIGKADRETATGNLTASRTGFIITEAPTVPVLCRGEFMGPARISVRLWDKAAYERAENAFHRDSGLLEGGLVILAIFVFLAALINREVIYIIFAGWLIVNLRLATISVGMDTLWLGRQIPADWLVFYRESSISAYYLLTVALFHVLFQDELKRVGFTRLKRLLQWSCIPMLLLIAAPFRIFLPVMWVMTLFAGLSIVFLMSRILFVARSNTAIWFAIALAIAMFSGFSEVIAAALGLKQLIGIVNSVTAALASSLIAALSIAQQMRTERLARVQAEAELRKTYQEIPSGLFTLDMAGTLLRGNPALHDMLGAPQDRFHADLKSWAGYFGKDQWDQMLQLIRTQHTVEMEVLESLQDQDRWFLVKAKHVDDSIEGSLQDITARVSANDRLSYLANHDPLTGVINRRGIEDALDAAIEAVTRGEAVCIAYLDLDRFKLINDLYGHVTGDQVLQQVCARIKLVVPPENVLGRIGGDEFLIILDKFSPDEGAVLCQALIDSIELEPFTVEQKAFRVGISVGLVELGPKMSSDDAITGADRACSEAKHVNHVVVYKANAPNLLEKEIELNLLKGFSADGPPEGLFLVMQPLMSLKNPYAALNFEVLLRMRRADNAIEPAWRVINAAENNGRIAIIDRWVLSNILEWIDEHYDRLEKTRFIDVNMSGGSLNDERFIADAFAMLRKHSRAAKKICLEITESVAVSDIDNMTKFADQARSLGCRLALDDFGVGYTSFSYLSRLPVDVLKVDGSLVSRALSHPTNLAIIESIAGLTRNLGMTSIAEWTDDLDTVKAMVEVGIDYIQAFIIAEPQLPSAILQATSAADFIKDPQVEHYVRTFLGGHNTQDLWETGFGSKSGDLH
ncbi:MAG: EAL domain-containing protein [Rhodocyclaceae bacterium]|nr:MAG: EAL domain-containing protein [Rhodocyclaceae bacterium]